MSLTLSFLICLQGHWMTRRMLKLPYRSKASLGWVFSLRTSKPFWRIPGCSTSHREAGNSVRPSQPQLPAHSCSPPLCSIWGCCIKLAALLSSTQNPSCGFLPSPRPETGWGLGGECAEHRASCYLCFYENIFCSFKVSKPPLIASCCFPNLLFIHGLLVLV